MLFLILIGILAGILAGLLGIGGGLVIVPAMLWWLQQQGVQPDAAIQIAIATSLASMLLTSLGSLLAHQRRGAVHWHYLFKYAPMVMLGAWLGSISVAKIAYYGFGQALIIGFAIFAIITAYGLWKKKQKAVSNQPTSNQPPQIHYKAYPDIPIGLVVGHLSSLLGTGGGSLNAPYFHWRSLPMAHSVGTAATCGYPLALSATAGFAIQNIDIQPNMPLIGSIAWQAAIWIGISGFICAPFGVKLAHLLPEQILRKVFATALLLLALKLITF